MKKKLAILIMIIMVFGTFSTVYATSYNDLKTSNWAYNSIVTMSDKGIIKGYDDGTFKPQNTLTYGEFIKMSLVASTGKDVGNADKPYHWASKYYDSGIKIKYFTEESIPKYKLDSPITRSDMALIISSILGDIKIENYDKIQSEIKDITANTVNAYDIIKVYSSGILTGYEDNTFKPQKTLTRAESAVIIHRLVDESKRILPHGEENSTVEKDKKVTIKFSGISNRTFEKTLKTAKLGDCGISKIQVQKNGDVAIFSTVQYDCIRLLIDNVVVSSVGNAKGTSYWYENGYYIYVAIPKEDGISTAGKVPTLWFLDGETLHKFANVTL